MKLGWLWILLASLALPVVPAEAQGSDPARLTHPSDLAGSPSPSPAEMERFDTTAAGNVPSGWEATLTGTGQPQWSVERDPWAPSSPNVLKQSGVATFPLCLKTGSRVRDGYLEVKFKAITGMKDQAGGVVWRAQDAQNYYVCRANALENNLVLYKVEAGQRKALDIVGRSGGYGVEVPVAPMVWHTLRVEFVGGLHTVFLDDRKRFEVEDSTFGEAGLVGLWTKADSETMFDDFAYNSLNGVDVDARPITR